MGPIDELEFGFSEKMDRQDAYRWLTLYPRRTIRKTSWKGARVARVRLEEPLPADTTVVVELAPGMRDAHKVPQATGRTFVFATGDSIDAGELTGNLVLDEMPLPGGVVEIIPAGPDSVRVEQRPVLRRAVADSTGHWRLRWLSGDGHPWLLRAFEDGNGDLRAGEGDAQRLFRDTLRLTAAESPRDLGVRVLYAPSTPGEITGFLAQRPAVAGPVIGLSFAFLEVDTGFVASPQEWGARSGKAIPDTGAFVLEQVPPGLARAVFFVDLDGDSLWTALGDSADTLWTLEPWALVDSILVEPGLATAIPAPVWPDTLTPWPSPLFSAQPDSSVAAADSLMSAPTDSLAVLADRTSAPTDSLAALADSLSAPVDSLMAPVDSVVTPED